MVHTDILPHKSHYTYLSFIVTPFKTENNLLENTGKNYNDLASPEVANFISEKVLTPSLGEDYSFLLSELINRALGFPFIPISSTMMIDLDGYGTLMITTTALVIPETRLVTSDTGGDGL